MRIYGPWDYPVWRAPQSGCLPIKVVHYDDKLIRKNNPRQQPATIIRNNIPQQPEAILRVLLIGGTALIGPHVIRELMSNDVFDLHTLTRQGKKYYCETAHQADRRDLPALSSAISRIRPDVIVDMIPFTAVDASNLVSAITGSDTKLIAVSSIDVYSAYACLHQTENTPVQTGPLTETMPVRKALGPEGIAYDKLSVEAIYNDNLSDVCILRLPAIYGWPDCTRVSAYLDKMLDGADKITLDKHLGNWKFSRCLHKNAAYAIALSVLSKQTGRHTYNVADEIVYTERQWIEKIGKACGWHGTIVESDSSDSSDKTINWLQDFYVSTEKIRSELDYFDKYSSDEGLTDTVAFHAYQRTGVTYKKYY